MTAEPAAGASADPAADAPELLVVTGMSGAGRSTAADVLEDLHWYVVDNLPPQMLPALSVLVAGAGGSLPGLAVVLDVRGRWFFDDLREALDQVRASGARVRTLFLEASDEALVRRFESSRRPHPLQGDGRILDGIVAEREVLRDLRTGADVVMDTTSLNVHQLAAKVTSAFSHEARQSLRVTVMSFGFKYGVPVDADHVVDVRFLPNPHWVEELRPLTGRDPQVAEYVLSRDGAADFLERYVSALEPVLSGYLRERKGYATIAVGCTGGKHRSVAMVERIAERLGTSDQVLVRALHRDLGRE